MRRGLARFCAPPRDGYGQYFAAHAIKKPSPGTGSERAFCVFFEMARRTQGRGFMGEGNAVCRVWVRGEDDACAAGLRRRNCTAANGISFAGIPADIRRAFGTSAARNGPCAACFKPTALRRRAYVCVCGSFSRRCRRADGSGDETGRSAEARRPDAHRAGNRRSGPAAYIIYYI